MVVALMSVVAVITGMTYRVSYRGRQPEASGAVHVKVPMMGRPEQQHREGEGEPSAPLDDPSSSLSPSSTLSVRGRGVKAVRDDLFLFERGLADPYDPVHNADGYLVMLVAENKLMIQEMSQKIQQVQGDNETTLPEWIFTYGPAAGQSDFVAAMARLFSKWIRAPVDPRHVKAQAGAGTVLAELSYLLGDTGDGVLVTAPNYPAFAGDFGVYGGMKLHTANAAVDAGFVPTVHDLDRMYEESVTAGHPPRILIICQPNNPTGTMYSKETIRIMVGWALDRDLHVVSDEIYALSVFPGYHTTSAADIMHEMNPSRENYLGDRVHIVAGLSKDWGLSGFRVGTLFSHNQKLLDAFDLMGYYAAVSQYTQHVMTQVLTDDAWVDWYISENQKRLFETYRAMVAALDRIDVPVTPARGALFAWADFSSLLLPDQTEKGLWNELATEAKILFTTGESCHENKPGMFRIVYPWPEGGTIAMQELGDRLVRWKRQRSRKQRKDVNESQ